MLPGLIIVVVASLGNVFLGLITYLKNPRSTTGKLFLLFTLALSSYIVANYLSLYQETDALTFLWIKIVITIAAIINLLFLLLVDNFPQTQFSTSKKIYIPACILTAVVVLATLAGLVFTSVNSGTNQPVPGPMIPLFLIQTILLLGGGIALFIKKFWKSKGLLRAQLGLFLMGTAVMFILILVTNVLLVLLFNTTAFVGLLPLYTLIFVGFVSYAIVRHRFLDIGLVVARTVSYTLLAGVIGLFYALFFGILSSLFATSGIVATVSTSTILALFMAFTFQPIRRQLEKVSDKIFFKDHYETSKLLYDLTAIMASTLELDVLGHKIMQTLIQQQL